MVTMSFDTIIVIALAVVIVILGMYIDYQVEIARSRRVIVLAAMEPAGGTGIGMGCMMFFILLAGFAAVALVITYR